MCGHALTCGLAAHDGERGVDGGPLDCGALGDLCRAYTSEGQLLDPGKKLALVHRGTVNVLGHLVDDSVRSIWCCDDTHWHSSRRRADLGSDHSAALAPQNDQTVLIVTVGGDGLQHASGLNRVGEISHIWSGVSAYVRADHEHSRIDLHEFLDDACVVKPESTGLVAG